METFGWVCFGIILLVVVYAILNKGSDEEEKKETQHQTSRPSTTIPSEYEIEAASCFNARFGIFGRDKALSFLREGSTSDEAINSWLSINLGSSAPSGQVFSENVRKNIQVVKNTLHFPHMWSVDTYLDERLGKIDDIHALALFTIITEHGPCRLISNGRGLVNYKALAVVFYTAALSSSDLFLTSKTPAQEKELNRLCEEEELIALDQDWTLCAELAVGFEFLLSSDLSLSQARDSKWLVNYVLRYLEERMRAVEDEYYCEQDSLSQLDSFSSSDFFENARTFLLYYGIDDISSTNELYHSVMSAPSSADRVLTMVRFVRDNESKTPPSKDHFQSVVEKNALEFSKSFPAPTKTFYSFLSQFTDVHINALWYLNLENDFFGGEKYGIKSLNYRVIAFALYCRALYVDLRRDFSYQDEERLIEFGRKNGLLSGSDDDWFNSNFFHLIRSIFRINITLEESQNIEVLTRKLEML